jgi:hypothetical protein
MAHAIRFEKSGGPDVLSWQQVEVGKPGQGEVRLRHTAVGLNYIDTYQRSAQSAEFFYSIKEPAPPKQPWLLDSRRGPAKKFHLAADVPAGAIWRTVRLSSFSNCASPSRSAIALAALR